MDPATALLLAMNPPRMRAPGTPEPAAVAEPESIFALPTPTTRYKVSLTNDEMAFYKKYVQLFEDDMETGHINVVLMHLRTHFQNLEAIHRPRPSLAWKKAKEENFPGYLELFEVLRQRVDIPSFAKLSTKALSALHYGIYRLSFHKFRQVMIENNEQGLTEALVNDRMAINAETHIYASTYFGFQALLYYLDRWEEVTRYDEETYGTRFIPVDSMDILAE